MTLQSQTDSSKPLRLVFRDSLLSRFEASFAQWSTGYEEWIRTYFHADMTAPLSVRHHKLWRWFDGLQTGIKPPARIDIWPRGGGKSTTGEMGCAYVGVKKSRKFVLYVCGTQDQADQHVQTVGKILQKAGVNRRVSKYGLSEGWRISMLRADNGFNVAAVGLDKAIRGTKLDNIRPDLIILDDIDDRHDTGKTVRKKIETIVTSILPTGSSDCAVLVVQNLIHENSIVAQLADGRAKFLLIREPVHQEPAVIGLTVAPELQEDGSSQWKVTGGTPTWEGQNLATCEAQINERGLEAFLAESQHEVASTGGAFFDPDAVEIVDLADVPALKKTARAWDLAATEGDGDFTAGVNGGIASNGVIYILDVAHGQWGSNNVRKNLRACADRDRVRHPKVYVRVPQDPAQAGKDQAEQLRKHLTEKDPLDPDWKPLSPAHLIIKAVGGSKAVRARGYADAWNRGNVKLVRGAWNARFIKEHKDFREDEEHDFDDLVDAGSDLHTELVTERETRMR